MMHWKWTKGLVENDFLNGKSYQNVAAWVEHIIGEHPAVKRGSRVLGWGPDAIKEHHSRADTFQHWLFKRKNETLRQNQRTDRLTTDRQRLTTEILIYLTTQIH
jgi:hypothetical protein